MFLLIACATAESPTRSAPEPAPEAPAVEEAAPEQAPAQAPADAPMTVGYEAVDPSCPACEKVPGKATATSHLTEGSKSYPAEQAFDGKTETAWCEGAEGVGPGSRITYTWDEPRDVMYLWLYPGYLKSEQHYFDNARPAKILITSGDHSVDVDIAEIQRGDVAKSAALGAIVPLHWPQQTSVEILIVDVYEGDKYEDLCISDIDILVNPYI